MGLISYGHDGLDAVIRDHGMSRAGDIRTLPDWPAVITDISPLWWEYAQAGYGAVEFKGGFSANIFSGLIPAVDDFTALTNAAVQGLHNALAHDSKRAELYGENAADLLSIAIDFEVRPITGDMAEQELLIAGGRSARIPEGVPVAVTVIRRTPSFVGGPYFFGLRDLKTRCTTLRPTEQADAVARAWREAFTARPRPGGDAAPAPRSR
ncbi:hypothetical protein [Streptomyces violascens]|uniref:Uncharacterized protein n=1 Tax=Streptomyces violascens TaxID=67381 RepID=A0ABQ3QUY1_9ACTN|nr:hypothetical protein [Streptomyces violascens]GHI41088.1 hypothetical protein Sviol_54960 [Streptomyces violascens]